MKKYFLLAFVFLVFGVGRMAAQSVNYTFDKNADFSKYKTYKWVSIKSAQQLDELTASQLTGTLEMQLAKKGLTKTESDDANLYIGYHIANANEKHLNDAIGLAFGSGVGGSSGAAGATVTTVHSGKLVLDMYDSGKRQLVWRGVVTNSIDPDAKPEKKQKHMDKAIEKLLKDYPPPKK